MPTDLSPKKENRPTASSTDTVVVSTVKGDSVRQHHFLNKDVASNRLTVSVLMSVYFAEEPAHFEEALHSIWTYQSEKPMEVILIEDGVLSEELYEIIDRWRGIIGDALVIVKNKDNLGLTKSLNKGIAIARGDLLARMDSDDISMPDRFCKQREYMEAHPDVSVVGGSMQEFNETEECLNVRHYPLTNEEVRNYIHRASPVSHPSSMLRRQMFVDGLKYNERFRICQDIALWYDVVNSGRKIANLPDILLKFRRSDSMFKRRNYRRAFMELGIYTRGIARLHGVFTWRYVYPFGRFVFRLLPTGLVRSIYESGIRKMVCEK